MSYIGTPPARRILSSADIAQGAVTLDDINFTDVPANMDISGTIDKHTMRLADGVTITGDVTISEDLVLAKLSDDGDAITMTNDGSSRTITGSGSIEASTLAATPQYESLTGMTGVLDSTVTGGAGLSVTGMTGVLDNTVQDNITRLGTVTSGTIGSGVTGTIGSGVSLNWGGCKVYKTSGQTISNATTTQVTFDTVLHDTLSEYSTGTSKYTATYAGIYIMNSTLMYVDMGDTKDLLVYILVNDSRIGSFDHKSSSANYESVACTTIHKLNAGDVVHINTRHAHGSNRDLSGYERVSQFTIQRIG